MLSYPISSKPTKIKHFTNLNTQKSNSHLTKNLPTISKSSLFISTFTDNNFPAKITNYTIYINTTLTMPSHLVPPISSLNLTKSTQIHFKIPPMIKSFPKHKTLLFLSQNEYKPNIGATIKLHTELSRQ